MARNWERLLALVDAQAEDDGLWFEARTAAEAYLQGALRKLHRAIENTAEGEGEIDGHAV